jgi:flagellum-specific peptidoglycan hydrolase FlgJ
MTPKEFVGKYKGFAQETENKTGISKVAILAQAAVESAWGKVAPGNMFFGVKDTDGVNGNEQLLTTTEYSLRPNVKFKNLISCVPVIRKGVKMFKYTIKSYFRKYTTPEESFTDHAKFLLTNPRYATALSVKNDAYKFIDELAKAGYATGPNYAELLKDVCKTIEKWL